MKLHPGAKQPPALAFWEFLCLFSIRRISKVLSTEEAMHPGKKRTSDSEVNQEMFPNMFYSLKKKKKKTSVLLCFACSISAVRVNARRRTAFGRSVCDPWPHTEGRTAQQTLQPASLCWFIYLRRLPWKPNQNHLWKAFYCNIRHKRTQTSRFYWWMLGSMGEKCPPPSNAMTAPSKHDSQQKSKCIKEGSTQTKEKRKNE